MRVLALDISKACTGWAVDSDGGPPRTGTWKGGSQATPGRAGALYSEWLCGMIALNKPEMIAYEAPMMKPVPGKIFMNVDTSFVLIGLAFLTETIAASYRLQSKRGNVATVRKHFVGHGYPDNPKAAVMERCRILGWEVENHDAADAAAVWNWAKCTFDRSYRIEAGTPLFARSA